MKLNVTHYADVSPYEAIQAMKEELYEKYRCGGLYDDVIFKDGVLYGIRYKEGNIHPDITHITISQDMKDVFEALKTLTFYYFKGESND